MTSLTKALNQLYFVFQNNNEFYCIFPELQNNILYFKYIKIKKAKSTQKLFINYLFNYQLTIDPLCLCCSDLIHNFLKITAYSTCSSHMVIGSSLH